MDIYQKTEKFYKNATTEKVVFGKSVFDRNLYAVKIGESAPVGLVQYAMHGREYITAELAFAQYAYGVAKGSCWFLPLVNPDGALLSQFGLDTVVKDRDKKYLLALNCGNEDFSLWKANGRGVDLNVNFAAEWGKGKYNTRVAGAENYIGEKPFSEPETLALKRFTEKIRPDYTVSYHTKGEEIYWYFYQPIGVCSRDKRLAIALSRSTGYPLAHAKSSAGGYKDWCVQKLGIPAFTIEAGADEATHPLGQGELADILQKNQRAIYDLSKEYGQGV